MSTPSDIFRVSLVQRPLAWEDKQKNLEDFGAQMAPLKDKTDLIVLPEMFSTGFSMNARTLSETEDGPAVRWMKEMAVSLQAVVTGSLIIEDGGHYFNRLFWMPPSGDYSTYSKRHLFSFANEERHYSQGMQRTIVEWKGWKVCPLVCYDLRFPVWSRNSSLDGTASDFEYDVLIYVANWPEARKRPWIALLEARAHENQAYVIGVNRVGEDGNGIPHAGDSRVFSPKGEPLAELSSNETCVKTVELSRKALTSFRAKFTAWKDKDLFRIQRD